MKSPGALTAVLVGAVLFSGVACPVLAGPVRLQGVPGDKVAIGNAMAAAWEVLYMDGDSLSHGGVHPGYLEQWLDGATIDVQKGLLKRVDDPAVLLALATRLAQKPDKEIRSQLSRLAHRFDGMPIGERFAALVIVAGDRGERARLKLEMGHPAPRIALLAAGKLAMAQERRAITPLLQAVRGCDQRSVMAARYLLWAGFLKERQMVEETIEQGCDLDELQAVSGQMAFATDFPVLEKMLERRDPVLMAARPGVGLYDLWMWFYRLFAKAASGDLNRLCSLIKQGDPPPAMLTLFDKEVIQRSVAAFEQFLLGNMQLMTGMPEKVSWPSRFEDAVADLTKVHDWQENDGRPAMASRVSAAIAILNETTRRKEEWSKGTSISFLDGPYRALTDGRLETVFAVRSGVPLVFNQKNGDGAMHLWLALYAQKGQKSVSARILGCGEVTLDGRIDAFQEIALACSGSRIRLVLTSENGNPVSVRELMVGSKL